MRQSLYGVAIAIGAGCLLAGCTTTSMSSLPQQSMAANLGLETPAPEGSEKIKEGDVEPTVRKAAEAAEASFNYSEAAQHYAVLLQKHPDDKDLLIAVARNLRFSGAPQQAAAVINGVLPKLGAEAHPTLTLELGKDYLAADQLNLAIPALEHARQQNPGDWQAYSALGVAFDMQGDYKRAQEIYQAGLKIAPNDPNLLNNYALSLAQAGQLDAAIAALQTAMNQPTAMAQTRQNMALLLAFKGDQDGAARLIRNDLPPEMAQNNIEYYRGFSPSNAEHVSGDQ